MTTPFDAVHDVQGAFRTLLKAFTFPGRLFDLTGPATRLASLVQTSTTPPALLAAAATLIDSETSYWVSGDPRVVQFLVEWSSKVSVAPEEAAFLLLSEYSDAALSACLGLASTGTLVDPHLGATVLVGLTNLAEGDPFTLTGPGLEHPLTINLPTGKTWPEVRNQRVVEFPLGLDLAFFDQSGRVLALPRTTKISRVVT
jgi:alpha-D-ribose 1-methylphosphonate 5-triphosphate synthase subunit PhnH